MWAAARATSAAPFYFKQHEHYADGGLKANNPSMSGLTTIHEYYTNAGIWNYKLSVVASLGCGKFYSPLDAEFRRHVPSMVHLNEIPDHLRHLRLITTYKIVREGYEDIKNLGTPSKGFLFDVLFAEVNHLRLNCNKYKNVNGFDKSWLPQIEQQDTLFTITQGLSSIHECSGGLSTAPSHLDNQTAICKSPYNWLPWN